MKFDRNTVIGFVLLAALFFGMFYYNNKQQAATLKERARQDSIARANGPKPDVALQRADSSAADSFRRTPADTSLLQMVSGAPVLDSVENEVLKVVFSNKGGQPRVVELKNFKEPDGSFVKLGTPDFDKINYPVLVGTQTMDVANLYFKPAQVSKGADNSQIVTFTLPLKNGSSVVHQFVVKPKNYMIDFNLQVNGVSQLFPSNKIGLTWQRKATQLQKDVKYERQQSQIGYRVDGDYDYNSAMSNNSKEFSKPVNWVAVKQQFFNTALIDKNNFSSGRIEWVAPAATDNNTIVQSIANLQVPLNNSTQATAPLALYYGPTDYKTLKQYGNDMESMVNLGSGMFAFVKYLNRWIVIPIFDLFAKLTSNYGIVILLLTLFIRLLISPLTYSSYLSGAKMKVLRPEIDQLKAKYGNDQQQISMEQMKLFREAGVNPLGGCIPGLLQIPIFFALYSFFNSNVALRGQSFLWAKDLSQSDDVIRFGMNLPLIGDHLSLFTLTAIITSFLISLYSMSMTPDQGNPVLKYMPYFFPIILLFVFNKLPSGLTWYYTVSNVITLVLQFIIQNYIINHDKILAKMEENRRKPKTKTKWQERMEQMQEQQKEMQKRNRG